MKLTLGWLRDHLETEASLDAIVEKLSMIGLEVEGVEDRGKVLAPFTVARVIEATQHPNADRLRVGRRVVTGVGVPFDIGGPAAALLFCRSGPGRRRHGAFECDPECGEAEVRVADHGECEMLAGIVAGNLVASGARRRRT